MSDELITNANPYDDRQFWQKERFAHFPEIEAKDLLDLDDPHPIWEGEFKSTDGYVFHVFTIGGWLVKKGEKPKRLEWMDGQGKEHGHTVAGDLILIDNKNWLEAKAIATEGLIDTLTRFVEHLDSQSGLDNPLGAGIISTSEIRGRR